MTERPTPGPYLQLEKRLTALAYALLAFSHFTLITGIIAVTINYASRQRVQGTWLASHCRWLIRTFWFSLLWNAAAAATAPFSFGVLVFAADAVWAAYRAIKGWIYLNRGWEMYASRPTHSIPERS